MKTSSLLPIDPADSALPPTETPTLSQRRPRAAQPLLSFAAEMHRAEASSAHGAPSHFAKHIRVNREENDRLIRPLRSASSHSKESPTPTNPKADSVAPRQRPAAVNTKAALNNSRIISKNVPQARSEQTAPTREASPCAETDGQSTPTDPEIDNTTNIDEPDSTTIEPVPATITPLAAAPVGSTIVPLSLACGSGTADESAAADSGLFMAALPISISSDDSAMPINAPAPIVSGESNGVIEDIASIDSANAEGMDPRQLGLETLAQRERRTLQLREAIARLEEEAGAEADEDHATRNSGATIIPFPIAGRSEESKIIAVQFTGASSANSPEGGSGPETQLPGDGAGSEKSAQLGKIADAAGAAVSKTEGAKEPLLQPPFRVLGTEQPLATHHQGATGTSVARKAASMESRPSSAYVSPIEGGADMPSIEANEAMPIATKPDLNAALATDWTGPRLETSDRSLAPVSSSGGRGSDAAGAVERIAKLVSREAVLFRHSNSDSMSVVLRPDAQTELMLHLSQRNGQIEANVRCERGDFHQLNALWSQLQETLAQQKVRLAPLEEAAPDAAQYRQGGGFAQSGRDGFSRQDRSADEFMEEWPAPASPQHIPASVRSRRESGHRLSTSRPGWETWA